MHICRKCNVSKPTDAFHKNRSKPGGLASWCRDCRLEWDKEYRKEGRVRDKYKAAWVRRRGQPHVRALAIVRNAKIRADSKDMLFDVSLERVEQAIQRGFCERTGVPFDLGGVPSGRTTNCFAPSIDKIKPEGCYIDDNIQIVCWSYNAGKGEMTITQYEDFIVTAAAYITAKRSKHGCSKGVSLFEDRTMIDA